ncbi:hypothetical protein BJ138DRAFT_1013790, partial [Hygrophoropsis aurantiaca]
LEESGCVKVTHTVEICPDVAKTLKCVFHIDMRFLYNQCASVMLRHAIKTHAGHDVEDLRSITGERLPPPLKPEDIDCILAGFPCQSHSMLNMYRKGNDLKSSLTLNVLSWVDYADPDARVEVFIACAMLVSFQGLTGTNYHDKIPTPVLRITMHPMNTCCM